MAAILRNGSHFPVRLPTTQEACVDDKVRNDVWESCRVMTEGHFSARRHGIL